MMVKLTIFLQFSYSFGSCFFFSKKEEKTTKDNESPSEKNMLCRFVLDGTGKRIGETVAVDNDIIIIKAGTQFMGVPLKHIEENGKTMLVKGLVDFTKAFELGETWRKASARDINEGLHEKRKHHRF